MERLMRMKIISITLDTFFSEQRQQGLLAEALSLAFIGMTESIRIISIPQLPSSFYPLALVASSLSRL